MFLSSGMRRQWTKDNIPNSKGLTKAAMSFASEDIVAVLGEIAKERNTTYTVSVTNK